MRGKSTLQIRASRRRLFPMRCISFAFALLFIVPDAQSLAAGTVRVSADIKSPLIDFAVKELRTALSQVPEEPEVILEVSEGEPEAFSIRKSGTGIIVQGGDLKGLMYGTLEVAERLQMKGRLEAIQAESQKPFLRIRALKFNIPLAGTMYLSEEDLQHNQWFWDLDYWQSFLDSAARNRYNSISFWSAHPYDRMVRLAKYPDATSLSHEDLDRNIHFFRNLFRMARERGIDPYLISWNIHLSPAFSKAHHIPNSNIDSELVRDYQRECIKTLLETYPDLVGLGTTQGERMDVIPEAERAAWISDIYFRAIRESGRREVPFILRYWGGAPAATQQAAAAYDRGPIYLDIKYNGEHLYSSTRFHVEDPAWLNQPHSYKLLWHLRNDDIYIFRWGKPQWVSDLIRNLAKTDAAGFTEGSEIDIPGIDRIHTPEARKHQTWKYKFEKLWFRFALWGRLAYNPDLPEDFWKDCFRRRFGVAGEEIYRATVAASRIAPTITSFHWNYMNGDWYPEGSIGSWNTAYEQPRVNYRRNEMFHSLPSHIFNNTIDASLEDILSYVAGTLNHDAPPAGTRSPLEVADDLEAAGRAALSVLEIPDLGSPYSNEYICTRLDNEAYGHLGHYYAEKIRGAVSLATFMFTGDALRKTEALAHLRAALDHWKALVTVTKFHYIPHEVWLFGEFHWDIYTPMVLQDIGIAEASKPFRRATQRWQVRDKQGDWQDFDSVVFSLFDHAGLHEWLLYFNTVYNSGRLTKVRPNARSVTWKTTVRSTGGERAVVEIAGDPSAQVTKGGMSIPASLPEATRSYAVFDAGEGGEILVHTTSAVPFLSQISSGHKAVFESAANGAQKTSTPLRPTTSGTLIVPESYEPPEDKIGVSSMLAEQGTVHYSFRVARPGFYGVWCLVRSTRPAEAFFFYTLDNWNGRGHSMKTPSGKDWKWVRSSHALGLGPGEHNLRLKFHRPGIELKQVRIAPMTPGGESE